MASGIPPVVALLEGRLDDVPFQERVEVAGRHEGAVHGSACLEVEESEATWVDVDAASSSVGG